MSQGIPNKQGDQRCQAVGGNTEGKAPTTAPACAPERPGSNPAAGAVHGGWSERVKLAKNSNFREILCFLANAGMRLRAIRLAADVLKISVLEAQDYVDKIRENWRAMTTDWPLPSSMNEIEIVGIGCESCGDKGPWRPKGQFDALCPKCGGLSV